MYILHSDFLKQWKFCFNAKLKILTNSLEFRLFPRLTANRAVKWCLSTLIPGSLGSLWKWNPDFPISPLGFPYPCLFALVSLLCSPSL